MARALRRRAEDTIAPRSPGTEVPLAFSQQRLWFLQQWAPEAPTFNAARAIRLIGDLDVDALRRALTGVVARHESLRTVVAMRGGRPCQHVLNPPELALAVHDATGPDHRDALLRELSREPFDLTRDLMFRADLVRSAPRDHVLLVRMHHIAGDAYSMPILFRDLEALYAGTALPAPPVQYGDFALWQQRRLRGARLDRLLSYWTAQLDGAPERLELRTDRPRPQVSAHEGFHHYFTLSSPPPAALEALGREEGATLFMVVLAAFATLLYRRTGQDDVVVGSPIANRTNAQLEDVVGFVSNTVALRVRLDGNPSFREVVRRARETVIGAYEHQELPFERVVQALRVRRDASHHPVFQVNMRAQAAPPAPPRFGGLDASWLDVDIGYSRFELALEIRRGEGSLAGYFEADAELFDRETTRELEGHLRALLEQAAAEPDAPVLTLPGGGRTRRRRPPVAGPARSRRPESTPPGEDRDG